MKFEYPAFLWAFLALIIPILLHLFHLRKFKVLYFSNIQFLKKVDTQSRSTRKIQQFLVLLSRLLAFSFLVLAFAQPYWPKENQLPKNKQVVSFYIDNSFSMKSLGVEGELLSQAKQIAQKYISKQAPSQHFLILSNQFSAEEQHIMSQADALDYIDQLDYSPSHRTLKSVLDLQYNLLQQENKSGPFFIITDGQKNAFKNLPTPRNKSQLYPLILEAENKTNRSIDSLWFSSPIVKFGQTLNLQISASIHGKTKASSLQLEIAIDEEKRQQTLNLDEEKKGVLNFSIMAPNIGKHTIRVKTEDASNIAFDDELMGVFEVQQSEKIAIINGLSATKHPEWVYQLDAFYALSIFQKNQLSNFEPNQYQLLVLNQVESIEYALSNDIQKYIEQGGSVVLIPAKSCDIAGWNIFLNKLNLPTLREQPSSQSSQYLNTIDQASSFFQGVFTSKTKQLQFPINKNSELVPSPQSRYHSLMSYSDQSPFLVKSTLKNRNVYLFNCGLGNSNMAFMQSDLFSTLFLRFAETAQASNPLYAVIGETTEFHVKQSKNSEQPITLIKNELKIIPQQKYENHQTTLYFNNNASENQLKSGFYKLFQAGEEMGQMAFNYNREESMITYYSIDEINDLFQRKEYKQVQSKEINEINQINLINTNNSIELWRIMLILAIVFLAIEMILLKFVNR